MVDYSSINSKIEEIVKSLEPIVQIKGAKAYYDALNLVMDHNRKKSTDESIEQLLSLFGPNMSSQVARGMLIYFIVQSRQGEVRPDIKAWVLNSLEKTLRGTPFDKAFSLVEKKPKLNIGKHLQIRAYFEALRRRKISFQDAQAICAEKWNVSETTVASIHKNILLPKTGIKTLEALSEIDFSHEFHTAR